MTLEESIKLLALIKLAYPNSYKDIDKDTQLATVKMWHRAFDSVPFAIMELALDHFVKVSKFPPTIAEMCEELKSIHSEAWEKTLLLEDGAERNVNKYIMQQTERFKERNEHRIKYSKVQNLLNSANQPLIEG
jgi:TRAP-type mannitol/chloroaromatic compound transport system substrate-binding protein